MNYFIVFQNKTYKEELKGEYLWAPEKDKNGKGKFYWANMTKVNAGDIIFSLVKRKIVSINIAKGSALEAVRPLDFDRIDLWEKQGWLIEAKYNVLKNPISIDENINEILKLCSSKYSAFTSKGRGNQGYLFEIGNEFGEYLLKLIEAKNNISIYTLPEDDEVRYIREIENINTIFKDETDKEIVIKARVGQDLFKKKLLTRYAECAICGLNIKKILRASHCKPWSKANDKERLDINNGLLLCPTHDALFDRGLITFKDTGEIIISAEIEESQYKLLNIDKKIRLIFDNNQISYIAYHRKEEFKGNNVEREIKSKEIDEFTRIY